MAEEIAGRQGPGPLVQQVDAIHLKVADLDSGIDFYCARLGHDLVWRTESAAGVSMGRSNTEFVLELSPAEPTVDFLVESLNEAIEQFTGAGGRVVHGPFDIPVGEAAVVGDPWGNMFVLLDLSKGQFVTDADKNVIGVGDSEATG